MSRGRFVSGDEHRAGDDGATAGDDGDAGGGNGDAGGGDAGSDDVHHDDGFRGDYVQRGGEDEWPVSSSATGAPQESARSNWRHFGDLELSPILTAALDAFYEHGFHGTTVRDIARRVGRTVPSLYYHHDNKEGIFVALVEKGTGDAVWRVRAAVAESGARADHQLISVVEALVLHMTYRARLAALDTELRHLSARNRKRYAERRKEIENSIAQVVQTGVRQNLFVAAQPDETARALLGMVQSIRGWYNPAGPLTPEALARRYTDIALRTVGSTRD